MIVISKYRHFLRSKDNTISDLEMEIDKLKSELDLRNKEFESLSKALNDSNKDLHK